MRDKRRTYLHSFLITAVHVTLRLAASLGDLTPTHTQPVKQTIQVLLCWRDNMWLPLLASHCCTVLMGFLHQMPMHHRQLKTQNQVNVVWGGNCTVMVQNIKPPPPHSFKQVDDSNLSAKEREMNIKFSTAYDLTKNTFVMCVLDRAHEVLFFAILFCAQDNFLVCIIFMWAVSL